MLNLLGIVALIILVYVHLVFVIALVIKDNSIMDIAWGSGFVIVSLILLFSTDLISIRQLIITGLITLWGARLSGYIYVRNRNRGEDHRYKNWREKWGDNWVFRSYLQVFLLQGVIMVILSLPLIRIASAQPQPLTVLDFIGILLWAVGFTFETVGDYQLRKFKSKPENNDKIMTSGLWRYTRHPNYFGESVLWWGIGFLAISTPLGWLTLVSPLTITILLLQVSGVTMLEKKYKDNLEYQQYKLRTPAFFPKFQTSHKS